MLRIQSSLGSSLRSLFGGQQRTDKADDRSLREGVYFFHIPKTAGVSIYRFLESVFPLQEICPGWLWDHIIRTPKAELNKYRIFRGHFFGYLEPYLGRELKKFTILRDPIERSISYYAHIRRDPGHPYYIQAQTRVLREFCLADDTRHLIENYQAQCLATLYFNPATVARDISEVELATFHLETAMEKMLYCMRDPEWLLHASMRSLELLLAVGITEDFENSLASFCTLLNCPMPKPRRENVAPDRPMADALDSATLEVLRELTQIDKVLHSHARERLLGTLPPIRQKSNLVSPLAQSL